MESCVLKPTVVGGVDAFEQATLGLEAGDAVPLAVKHLQPGEDRRVQVRQPVVPHVQLGHVPQQVRLIWHHAGDLIQPDRGSRGEAKVQLQSDQAELPRLWPFLRGREHASGDGSAASWLLFSAQLFCAQHFKWLSCRHLLVLSLSIQRLESEIDGINWYWYGHETLIHYSVKTTNNITIWT